MEKEIVAVSALILNSEGDLLVQRRPACRPNDPIADLWETPGGKVEEGEDLITGLVRELEEELGVTGVTVNPRPVLSMSLGPPASRSGKFQIHFFYAKSEGPFLPKEGQPEIRFRSLDALSYNLGMTVGTNLVVEYLLFLRTRFGIALQEEDWL